MVIHIIIVPIVQSKLMVSVKSDLMVFQFHYHLVL